MNAKTILLVALLASVSAPAAAEVPERAGFGMDARPKLSKKEIALERHAWMAQYFLRKGNDLDGAAGEYRAMLALDPGNVSAALALSSLYRSAKKTKQAVAVLTALSRRTPKEPAVWLELAKLDAEVGDDKAMRVAIHKLLTLTPRSSAAYWVLMARAVVRLEAGDLTAKPEALEAARQVMGLARRNGSSYRAAERLVLELSADPVGLAIYDAKRAFEAAFEHAEIGEINVQMGIARAGFETCVAHQPANEECHYYLGLVYASVKASEAYDSQKALAELARAPGIAMAWVEAGRLLRASDKNVEARAAFDQALAIDPALAIAHVERGILDKLEGKTDRAVAEFETAFAEDRVGAAGDRALRELATVSPTHRLVRTGVLMGRGDIFSTERFKSVLATLERELGGVEVDAPEQPALEEIVRRLADASGVEQHFRVQLVASKIVNSLALADGNIYVTRGLLDLLTKKFPSRPIDANNDILGHVLGHELQHVIRRHTLSSALFREAVEDASRPLDAAVVTHVTRLHEVDADRQGMVMAFLAGYHPRGGIEFMELMGKELEVPAHLDHPTFDERIEYLSEYWTNDVRYAFVSFKLGVAAIDRGAELEATNLERAIRAYEEAVDDFKRVHALLPSLKEASNDLGVAYAKIGVLAMSDDGGGTGSPMGRWQTPFSLERESSRQYVALARDPETLSTRGADKARLPWQMREAIASFREALASDDTYARARLNLAASYLAANQLDNANAMLAKLTANKAVAAGEVELVRGVAFAESKDYARATAAFEKALAAPASARAAAYNLAKTLELSGKKDDAKRSYQQYAKQYPGGPWGKAAERAAAAL